MRALLDRISGFFHAHASRGRTLLALGGAGSLLALLPLLGRAYPPGAGTESLDALGVFSYQEFLDVVDHWGPAGRSLAPIFDLLENISILLSILAHPNIPLGLYYLKTGATLVKFGCGVPIGIVLLLLVARRPRSNGS